MSITISDNSTPIIRPSMCEYTMANPGPAAMFEKRLQNDPRGPVPTGYPELVEPGELPEMEEM